MGSICCKDRRDRQPTSTITIESLISAIESIDVDTVEKLLKSDFENEYRNSLHYSVLHIAVKQIFSRKEIDSFEFKSKKHQDLLYRSEALHRIVEVLLESGRFNVNALTDSSTTPLLCVVGYTKSSELSSDAYRYLVNPIIELLLKNNANINAKTSFGQTPLMRAALFGHSQIVKLLLEWRDELGAGVDLNARDRHGETALIIAAKEANVNVIELLLQHGCLDEFHDHRGFYALHAVVDGSDYSSEYTSIDFLAVIGVLASEKNKSIETLHRISFGQAVLIDRTEDDSIQETVRLLVTRGRADINSKDFRGNTVLDLALKSKRCISRETVEMLKEYGATSGALLKNHPDYPKTALEYTDKLGKTPLHRLSAVLPSAFDFGEKTEIMRLLNSSPHKEAFQELTVAKDNRGRTALHYAVFPYYVDKKSENMFLFINFMTLAQIINERDKYGRTPLHYCEDEGAYKSLVEQGANEHMQDIDGKTPRDINKLRNEEHSGDNFFRQKIYPQKTSKNKITWTIWKELEYVCRNQFSRNICDKVRQFMNRLSFEIRKKDPRLECRTVLVGSAEEGTKTGLPDEFDFNFILTKLGELCEVVPSPGAPSGFVHLKRRYYNSTENRSKSQHFQSQENFDKFFNSGGFLLTSEIACRFRILYLQVLSEPEFWEDEDFFERDPYNEVGRIYDKLERSFSPDEFSSDLMPSNHPCSTIQLKLNRPIEGKYMFTPISLDIVPCIKLNGWWPEEALSGVNDEIKIEGCHLVFDQPQRNYPWVPFADPFARISFAPAEVRIVKDSSAVARAAYMVGKQMLLWEYFNVPNFTYVLKTCLLYCIEALKDCTGNSVLYEDINPSELRFFVEKLMLCFKEFYLQDFHPCYMMPSFHLPMEGYLKSNHDQSLNDSSLYPWFPFSLYTNVYKAEFPVDCCPPNPEPLNEKCNREELLRKLNGQVIY